MPNLSSNAILWWIFFATIYSCIDKTLIIILWDTNCWFHSIPLEPLGSEVQNKARIPTCYLLVIARDPFEIFKYNGPCKRVLNFPTGSVIKVTNVDVAARQKSCSKIKIFGAKKVRILRVQKAFVYNYAGVYKLLQILLHRNPLQLVCSTTQVFAITCIRR